MAIRYTADTDRLGLGRPDLEPYASEYIGPIVDLIARLIDSGSAYAVDGDVYFRVRSVDGYGELSRRDLDQMDQGEGVEGAERKQDPLDFALWKAHKEDEDTSWEAPWGRGRPGWHIECSAMAEALLGVGFDIHGGGLDLVFPHHENEAAQTFAGHGHPLARLWVHNGMLEVAAAGMDEKEKMSKSVGNIRRLSDVLDEVGPEALLMYFMRGHYRQPISFSDDALADAARTVERIRDAGRRLVAGQSPAALREHRDAFFAALRDDYNTPEALAAMFRWVREANRSEEPVGDGDLREMLGMLGLESLLAAEERPPEEALELAALRDAARADRDWPEADRLRDELRALGWEVRDGPDGAELVRAA
jgi:cysteinyl-tRNA synthetase